MKKNTTRPGVLFYFDDFETLKMLDKPDLASLFEAAMVYGRTGVLPKFDGMLAMAWGFLKPRIDADGERYNGIVQQKKYASYCAAQKRKGLNVLCFEDWVLTAAEQDAAPTPPPPTADDRCQHPLTQENRCQPLLTDDTVCSQPVEDIPYYKEENPPIIASQTAPDCRTASADTEWYPITDTATDSDSATDSKSDSVSESKTKTNINSFSKSNPEEGAATLTWRDTDTERSRFLPPDINDVRRYCIKQDFWFDAEEFLDHFSRSGWKIGQTQLRDWHTAARIWAADHSRQLSVPKQPDGQTQWQ